MPVKGKINQLEVSESGTPEVVVKLEVKPVEILSDFGRDDLNALRDAVNYLLRR